VHICKRKTIYIILTISSSFNSPTTASYRFLSVDRFVYEYDLRKATAPILREPTKDLSPCLQNQDEVNQITLAYFQQKTNKRKGHKNASSKNDNPSPFSLYLAAADDTGTVRFMDTSSPNSSNILHHDPKGVAVIPTCVFRPGQRGQLELASGGTDCKIQLWDALKQK
jgi:WD40 repeat protein